MVPTGDRPRASQRVQQGSRGPEGIFSSSGSCIGSSSSNRRVGEDTSSKFLLGLLKAGTRLAVQGVDPLQHHDSQHCDAGEEQGDEQHEHRHGRFGSHHHQSSHPAAEAPPWDANGLEDKEHILDEENEEKNEEIE